MNNPLTAALLASLLILTGCHSAALPPITTVPHVELPRFMGDWYVIASIPTYIEKGAHNAVESYRLDEDGTIATTFTFRADRFDGPEKRYHPRGFVRDPASNAIWGMQFIWPIKTDYRIIYLNAEYSQTMIGRKQRDYLWIMARTPQMAPADYARAVELAGQQGYDVSKIQLVPQRWAPVTRG